MNTKAHVTVTEHYVRKTKRLFHGKIWSWLGLILHWFLPLESCLNAYTFAQILHSGVFSSKSWVKKFHIVDFTILCFLSGRGCSFDRTAQVLHALKFSTKRMWMFHGSAGYSACFRGLRVSEGLQRVGGGMGTGVPRSVPASSVPAFRGLTRTRRSFVGTQGKIFPPCRCTHRPGEDPLKSQISCCL